MYPFNNWSALEFRGREEKTQTLNWNLAAVRQTAKIISKFNQTERNKLAVRCALAMMMSEL